MSTHSLDKSHAPVVDPDHGWAVYWCDHGCVHVALDRMTLTLTANEFEALRTLLSRVRTRLDNRIAGPVRRAH